MAESNQQTHKPSGVFNAIREGFELTTRNWWILVLPVLFDCFLWLGPRLRIAQPIRALYDQLLTQVPAEQAGLEPEAISLFYELLERANLFVTLSVPVFGVPALMNGAAIDQTPVVVRDVAMTSLGTIFQYSLGMLVVGLLMSGLYYAMAAAVVNQERGVSIVRGLPEQIIRMPLLGLTVYLILICVMVPLIFVSTIAALFSIALAYIVLIGGSVFVMWAVIFASFSAQAMYLDGKSPLRAVRQSMRFIRRNLGRALPLLLIIVVANSTLDSLWLAADNGTWFTLVSIAGHAFVATSLVLATFIFYRDNAATPAIQN